MLAQDQTERSRDGGMETVNHQAEEGVTPARFTSFVRVLAVCTALLVFVGAMVTTTGSGLSVPDWPLSFGGLNPRMVGGVRFEHGHRLVAAAVGFLTLVAAFWASLVQAPRFVRWAAWFALGLVILQGLLGGLTVLMKLPTAVSVAHGCTAQLFLCTIVALVLLTTPSFVDAPGRITGPAASGLRLGSVTALIIVFLQLVVGATMRHMGAGLIIPDFPTSMGRLVPPLVTLEICINFAHRCLAVMVLLAVGLLVARIYREHRGQPALPKLALGLSGLVLVQITLGALTVWSRRGLFPTSLHVMNGALVLATTFAIVLWSFRLTSARRESTIVGTTATGTRADWMELAKMRLVTLSAFTAGCGYWLSTSQPRWSVLAMVVVGIFLLGGGSSVLNHVFEVETDALMARTRNRPLPAGRVSTVMAERVGAALGLGGVLFLGVAVRPLCGILALLAMVSYLFIYTPLKRTTPMCTLVGAVPGALPVLIGWTAGTGQLDIGGWILFLILFVWQLPHFMAIAWLCREDYARAGLPMLTVVDPAGGLASLQTLVYCLALVPISLAPTLYGMTGLLYSFIALILGVVYLVFGVRMSRERTTVRARQLLMASVIYLPLLYGAMMINR